MKSLALGKRDCLAAFFWGAKTKSGSAHILTCVLPFRFFFYQFAHILSVN